MYRTTYLEWLFEGEWHRIGWAATTPKSSQDLWAHGEALSAHGGQYRLVTPSAFADAPDEVLHVFPVLAEA